MCLFGDHTCGATAPGSCGTTSPAASRRPLGSLRFPTLCLLPWLLLAGRCLPAAPEKVHGSKMWRPQVLQGACVLFALCWGWLRDSAWWRYRDTFFCLLTFLLSSDTPCSWDVRCHPCARSFIRDLSLSPNAVWVTPGVLRFPAVARRALMDPRGQQRGSWGCGGRRLGRCCCRAKIN